jgi:predicted dehydrogenase
MSDWTRRTFLKATGAALSTGPVIISKARGEVAPSERIRHAVIGTGGQGTTHARAFAQIRGCEVAAVCDVDPERRAQAAKALPNSEKVARHEDFRKVLDDTNIDTVSIATCDHWHTPIALAALMAGKHVYVEKPCSHNVAESHLLVDAAKQFGKCVQHGTQARSGETVRAGIRFLREGGIGKVRAAKAINHQLRGPIGRAPESDPPAGVNYDLWLGPAPKRPFTRNRWHYNWHWMWDYGTGDIGNDGIHQVDVARWGLGVTYPKAVVGAGGQLFYNDDHETPDTQMIVYEYDGCQLIFEMRLWTAYPLEGHDNGDIFYGDEGTLDIGREGCHVTLKGKERRKLDEGKRPEVAVHCANFLEAVRANDPSRLAAPIEEGAISATLSHLGNIVTRIGGGRIEYDPKSRTIPGNAQAAALLKRDYRAGYELPFKG